MLSSLLCGVWSVLLLRSRCTLLPYTTLFRSGFDWRWSGQLTFLAVDFAAPDPYRGAHCLRIDFTVTRNQEYEPVYQIVPVRSEDHKPELRLLRHLVSRLLLKEKKLQAYYSCA